MKKLILAMVLLLFAAAGVAYYFYQKISYQPEWYAMQKTSRDYALPSVDENLEKKIEEDLKKGKPVQIPADRIVPLLVGQLEKMTDIKFRKAVKAVRSTVKPTGIEVEVIADVRKVATEGIPDKAKKAFDQLIKHVPENALNDLYIKCDLRPMKQGDFMSLDPSSSISVGKMNFPMAKLAEKFDLNQNISLKDLSLSDFDLKDGAIVLKPAATK